jgi:hypothetical protein
MNGRHHRCFETAMASAVLRTLAATAPRAASRARRATRFVAAPCLADAAPSAAADAVEIVSI